MNDYSFEAQRAYSQYRASAIRDNVKSAEMLPLWADLSAADKKLWEKAVVSAWSDDYSLPVDEAGRDAYIAHVTATKKNDWTSWHMLSQGERAAWAAVEKAISG